MIIDLCRNDSNLTTRSSDFLIVGGGTAGLLLAKLLTDSNFSVIVMESGDKEQESDHHPFNDVVMKELTYSGAKDGRFRCLGGTSTRWGGAMIPFLQADVRNFGWEFDYESLLEFVPYLEKLFQLNNGPYEVTSDYFSDNSDYILRSAKWPNFKNRNLALLFKDEIESTSSLEVWLNATAVEFKIESDNVKSVLAKSINHKQLRVEARHVIIASGAIEVTRILLSLENRKSNSRKSISGTTGRNFSDHISAPVASLVTSKKTDLNKLFGYQFEKNGVMRNIRFELRENSDLRKKIPPHFFHISFVAPDSSPFYYLRNFYRQIQQGNLPSMKTLFGLLKSLPWLLRAAYWKFFQKRLLYPKGSRIEIHLVMEQEATISNSITLSPRYKDVFGVALPEITWKINASDISNFTNAANAFRGFWDESGLNRIAKFQPYDIISKNDIGDLKLVDSGGIFHPTGTTPIGNHESTSSVSSDLKVHGFHNLYLISTSIFKRGCGSNPTMTELLFTLRLAKFLEEKMTICS
jgi:choline dehydrogenase-like flavoprotein